MLSEFPMTTTPCPICEADAEALPSTVDFDGGGFHCPAHGKFEVSSTAMMTHRQKGILDWEKALDRAQARAGIGNRPRIEADDFV
jgi:hypothetical protein